MSEIVSHFIFFNHMTVLSIEIQKQPSRDVLIQKCSENMQQISRRTPMMRCDFNKGAMQLYRNYTSA